ncbi:MAG: GNAT family N-acetyltransferase, partial [Methylocystaceae bacterium]
MSEIRLAKAGEIARQKEIWKLCFGDPDQYIDFFYANRYHEQDTMVLIEEEIIVSMLTMIPVEIVAINQEHLHATMLYAIATHPQYQHQG